jgi:hypothetical protein
MLNWLGKVRLGIVKRSAATHKEGARDAANYNISLVFRPILTLRGAANYLTNPVRVP